MLEVIVLNSQISAKSVKHLLLQVGSDCMSYNTLTSYLFVN